MLHIPLSKCINLIVLISNPCMIFAIKILINDYNLSLFNIQIIHIHDILFYLNSIYNIQMLQIILFEYTNDILFFPMLSKIYIIICH